MNTKAQIDNLIEDIKSLEEIKDDLSIEELAGYREAIADVLRLLLMYGLY
jgi:hypothetical protein